MTVTEGVDMLIGIMMLLSVLIGYHRGLLITIARIAAMVISYIGAVVIAGQIADGVTYAGAFFVVFTLLQGVCAVAIHALRLVDKLPVVGMLNKLAGGVLGFLWVFLLCLLLAQVFFLDVPASLRHQWGFTQKAVQQTVLLKSFVP